MKCVSMDGKIGRVSNARAIEMVATGAQFAKKEAFKEQQHPGWTKKSMDRREAAKKAKEAAAKEAK